MAINFPNSPTDGQTVVLANKTLVWSSATGTWNVQSSASSGGGSLSISDTAPSSPSDGDMWFNSTSLNLYAYYDDGDSQQWIELSSNDAQMAATVSDTAPSSPVNGDFWFDSSTLTWYTYYDDGDSQQWLDLAGQATTVQVTASDTAPTSPSTGQLWFDTANLNLFVYYSDGSSNQWVQMNSEATAVPTDISDLTDTGGLLGSGGVTAYANLAAFPSSGNTEGDFAFAQDTKALYVWDGTEWDRISSGINESPIFSTEPASEYELTTTGTATTITIAASDPEGFPIVYDHVTNPSNQTQATITNSGGTFTITPSTNSSDEGSFSLRFRASDGTHVSSRTSTFSLSFYNGYATQYLALTSGNLTTVSYSGSGTDSLNSIIDAASDGDALLLDPGVYELDPTNWDGYNSSNWRGKAIAIVGKTKDPADVVLNLNDAGAREKPIFSEGTVPTDHDHHFANMRVVRLGVPNPAADNYRSALRRGDGGGYLQNCIVDLNGNPVSWVYSTGSTRYGSFINCSFVNYSSWLTNYNGDHSRVRITDCAFAGGYNSSVSALGTNQTSVSFGAGYTYTDNGSTYGHMKGINSTPTVSITAPI